MYYIVSIWKWKYVLLLQNVLCYIWKTIFWSLEHLNNTEMLGTGNSIQLSTGFKDISSFVWPEDGPVARSRSLKATVLVEDQTKLLLSQKPVFNCFVMLLHFSKWSFFQYCLMKTLSTHVHQVQETEQTHYFLRQNDMSS